MNRTESQRKLYFEWKKNVDRIYQLKSEKDEAIKKGDEAYERLKNIDHDKALEAGDDSGWITADSLNDAIMEIDDKNQKVFDTMKNNPYPNLDNFESCAQIGRSFKKKIEITFLDGEKKTGLMYPWESDYSGPPYCFECDNRAGYRAGYSDYIENGWEIAEIKEV